MARPRASHALLARDAARLLDEAGLPAKVAMELLQVGSRMTLWRLATAWRRAWAGEEGGDVEKVYQKLVAGVSDTPSR